MVYTMICGVRAAMYIWVRLCEAPEDLQEKFDLKSRLLESGRVQIDVKTVVVPMETALEQMH